MNLRLAMLAGCTAFLVDLPISRCEEQPAPPSSALDYLDRASSELESSQLEDAVGDASRCIALDSKNVRALEVRAHAYAKEKLWDRAERDYAAANDIAPSAAYRFQMAEIRFVEKDYSNARPRFTQLVNEPSLGDLARYKIFLCDLLAGHDLIAARDLADLDSRPTQPSFSYGHATWFLFHNDRTSATQLFSRASHLYGETTQQLYLGSLIETQRFQPAVATFRTKDGQHYTHARVVLETDGLRASSSAGWVTLPIGDLPDDLSPFPADLRSQIERRRAQETTATASPEPSTSISFTTREGKTYDHVRWRVDDDALIVMTEIGWKSIPLGLVPDDISSFPDSLQQVIRKERANPPRDDATIRTVSFQTTSGRDYENLRASLTDGGLRVLTPDGWVLVPAADISSTSAGIPADWRASLASRRAASGHLTGVIDVSFVTIKGKSYGPVRATLASEGLHLLTENGWELVTYDQLPADLSPFPPEWRDYIQIRKAAAFNLAAKKP
jgi:Tfp pilus assembly protein PilF